MKKLKQSPETTVNHAHTITLPEDNRALVSPVHISAKFSLPGLSEVKQLIAGKRDGYLYSRIANPTVRELELLLAELQGRGDALCFGSGVGAIAACFLALLEADDHAILFLEGYKPSRTLLTSLLAKFNVSTTVLPLDEQGNLEEHIQAGKTKLVHFESPTNPTTRIADIAHITSVARKHGVLSVLDNTFAGFHNHGQYPVDLFIHSLTKFAGGHSDAFGGIVIGSEDLIRQIHFETIELGNHLDPASAFLILRGMKTYHLRYKKHCENAQRVAEHFESHPKVKSLLYPGLKSHPDHARAQDQMNDMGAVIYIDLHGGTSALEGFISALSHIQLTGSLGCTESLVAPVQYFYGRDLDEEQRELAKLTDGAVRLAIGIEHVDDLIADIEQALDAVPVND